MAGQKTLIKLELLGYCVVKKNYKNMSSRFHRIPERDEQTHGQIDSIAISISRVSMLMRDKKTGHKCFAKYK